MALGYKDLLARADAAVTSVEEDAALAARADPGTVFIDIRDVRELERDGLIPGARHAPARHAGILDRPGKPVSQALVRRGQDLRLLLRLGLAVAAGRRGGPADGGCAAPRCAAVSRAGRRRAIRSPPAAEARIHRAPPSGPAIRRPSGRPRGPHRAHAPLFSPVSETVYVTDAESACSAGSPPARGRLQTPDAPCAGSHLSGGP
jgi:hypothetical protein